MPGRLAVLTPFDSKPAERDSKRVWWKRVLPVGEIDYKGRKLHFDRGYLETLASSFNDQAYDQVPFQLADAHNTHTNDPERFRGEIERFEVRPDGLWMGMRPTPEGDRLLLTNPKLGVSARIVEQYQRSDGKFYPAAIQHVLGTLDPRIPQLGPWQAVEMSNTAEQVVDLSGYAFAGEEDRTVPTRLTQAQQARVDRLLDLPDEEFERFLAMLGDDTDEGDGDGDELSDEELAGILSEVDDLTDEELAAIEAEIEASQYAGAGAGLSNYGGDALELANIQLAEQAEHLRHMQAKMDEDAYKLERQRLANQGIPPYITDMAQDLLKGSGHVVELSNGRGVDAGLIMRKVLTEFGAIAGMLDLSGEIGSGMDEPDNAGSSEAARSELVNRYRNQVGL